MLIFYGNGVIYWAGAYEIADQQNREELLRRRALHNEQKDIKYSWGVFHVDSTTIKFSRWSPSSGGGLPSALWEGEILNDTTFRITNVRNSDGNTRVVDELYHFRELSPKPDSTNRFIE